RDRDTEIPRSSGPPKKVGDEVVYTGEDDRVVTTAASLEAEHESGNINKTQPTATLNEPSPQGTGSGSRPRRHVTTLGDMNSQTRFETASKQSHDLPLSKVNTPGSREDSMEHQDELTDFVPPTPYDLPLLEEELNLSNKESGETKVFDYTTAAEKDVNAAEPVSTAGDAVNAASVIHDVSTVGPSTMIHDVEEEPMRATPPQTVQSHDKGKGKMMEPKPISKNPIKAQIQRDAKIAQRLYEEEQAQFEREQRIAREKATEQEAKDVALIEQMEDFKAMIDADALLAERLQQEEREQFTVDEQARMLVDLIAERKRFFAAQRAEQIRNKPPTKAQLRNKMVTYLKHIGKYTHSQLKSKSFKEIQVLYEREQKWINDFVPMDSEEVNDTSRPDIMFVVCACARFQVTPKTSHLYAMKRIFRYLKGQPKLGLWYPRYSPFNLEAFSNSDYAGVSLDRKSTTGEYVVAASCYGQILEVVVDEVVNMNYLTTSIFNQRKRLAKIKWIFPSFRVMPIKSINDNL
nr:hypothetical protein [Tanacetum cinerariifolium]